VKLRQQAVGERVRQLREERGMSLRALASATDFSPSFISQLEHGLVSPSIASMERIAATLGVSLGEFFASLAPGEGGLVVRAEERVQVSSGWSHATIEALGPMRRNTSIEPMLITLAAGGQSGKHPTAPRREEFSYLLEGEVELTLGPDTWTLRAGDSATILTGELRRWANHGTLPARILVVALR
jgi:transcriptional regulator with XRE-family HTH domain